MVYSDKRIEYKAKKLFRFHLVLSILCNGGGGGEWYQIVFQPKARIWKFYIGITWSFKKSSDAQTSPQTNHIRIHGSGNQESIALGFPKWFPGIAKTEPLKSIIYPSDDRCLC